ncbi:MAG: type II secretion system GspH family protein [Heliobacteriaceae bacterium]|nr:type II secretion system GspH family protein [Heliobacteriaceae bacterium]
MKKAFTLAEVLITLGIIGVVAALTIPALVAKHNKKIAEIRLQKFYSAFNQAINLANPEYGPMAEWNFPPAAYNAQQMSDWYDMYIRPYMKTLETAQKANGFLTVYFSNGSYMDIFNHNAGQKILHANFYTHKAKSNIPGKNVFMFLIHANEVQTIEPYKPGLSVTIADRQTLLNHASFGCDPSINKDNRYCAALIQYEGWKIPDDYPFKF